MKDVVLKIDGMSCGHCVRAVENTLKGLSGVAVRQVQIGSAEVRLDDPATVGTMIDALADAGYSAEERVG